jgi:hypothetical protein
MDIDDPLKQPYSWQRSDTSVRSWKREFKEELYDTDYYHYYYICANETKMIEERSLRLYR